jgi:hypothetical protein
MMAAAGPSDKRGDEIEAIKVGGEEKGKENEDEADEVSGLILITPQR